MELSSSTRLGKPLIQLLYLYVHEKRIRKKDILSNNACTAIHGSLTDYCGGEKDMLRGSETGEVELTLHDVCRRPRKRSQILLMISLLSLLTVTSCTPIVHGESAVTYLSFTPPTYLATEAGELFNVTIDVSNVQNLRNATFIVAYNASLLDVAQVLQGQFFPSPPRSHFEFKKDDVLGLVKINMSLANPESPRSGNGTLACICFRVAASPAFPAYSPIEFQQTSLLGSASNPIIHDVGAAVYFWKLIQPDPATQGRYIDL
jgi:hypothetical protein